MRPRIDGHALTARLGRYPAGVLGRALESVLARARQSRRCPGCGSPSIEQPLAVTRSRKDPLRPRQRVMAAGCRRCGLLFVSPRPRPIDLVEYYRADGEWMVDRERHDGTERKRGSIVAELDAHINIRHPPPGAAVLDVGCGHGHWLNTFADCGWRTAGIEPATKLAFTRHAEFTEVPVVPTFDVIILSYVLEHLLDVQDMLRRVSASLRQDGWAFVTVPSLSLLPQHRDWKYCLNSPTHLNAYTEECLVALFGRVGLVPWGPFNRSASRASESKKLRMLLRKTGAPSVPASAGGSPLAAAVRSLKECGLLLPGR